MSDTPEFKRFKEYFNFQGQGELPTISQMSLTTRIGQTTIRNYLTKLNLEKKVKLYVIDGKISKIYKLKNI